MIVDLPCQFSGIKVVIELVPNHTSRRHKWFVQSRLSGVGNPYKNYYVWNKGRVEANGTRLLPNNWACYLCFSRRILDF